MKSTVTSTHTEKQPYSFVLPKEDFAVVENGKSSGLKPQRLRVRVPPAAPSGRVAKTVRRRTANPIIRRFDSDLVLQFSPDGGTEDTQV